VVKLEAQEPDRTPSMAAKAAAMGIPSGGSGLAGAEGWPVAEVVRRVLGLAVMLAAGGSAWQTRRRVPLRDGHID